MYSILLASNNFYLNLCTCVSHFQSSPFLPSFLLPSFSLLFSTLPFLHVNVSMLCTCIYACLNVCVCACVYVVYMCEGQNIHVPVWWVRVYTCERVCGGQRLVYGVVLDTSSPCIMRQGLLHPELADAQLSLASQLAPETVRLCLHMLSRRQATESTQFLGGLLGSKCWFSRLSDKCFNC